MNPQLDRYLAHRWLTAAEHAAGLMFAEDHAAALGFGSSQREQHIHGAAAL